MIRTQSVRYKMQSAFTPLEVRPARRARRQPFAPLEASSLKMPDASLISKPLTGQRGGLLQTGFTLVEMLIVTVILSVVAMTTFAILSNGLRIWQTVNKPLPEEDLNIFFDKFSHDLSNTFKFTGIVFSGTIEKAEFPSLVNSLRLQEKTVGKLIYEYEPQHRILNRYQLDFSDAYSGENKVDSQQSLSHVETLKFKYYLYDEQKKEYLWQDEWSEEGLPLAVRVELEFDNGAEINKFIKTVDIPSRG